MRHFLVSCGDGFVTNSRKYMCSAYFGQESSAESNGRKEALCLLKSRFFGANVE
jgi:hypothetical protein